MDLSELRSTASSNRNTRKIGDALVKVFEQMNERIKALEQQDTSTVMDMSCSIDNVKEPEPSPLTKENLEQLAKLNDQMHKYDELNDKLSKELEQCEDLLDDDDEVKTVCTDQCYKECEKLLKEDPQGIKMGGFGIKQTKCKSCAKQLLGQYKKASKEQKKRVKVQEKQYAKAQQKLLELEKNELSRKIRNIKKNKPHDYKIDPNGEQLKEDLKRELQKIREEGNLTSSFFLNINL